MLVIGGKNFTVRALSPEAERAWLGYVDRLARSIDTPAQRFIEKHCAGLAPDDQQRLLNAWLASPDWDAPSEESLREARGSRMAACLLAVYCLTPTPTWDEAKSLIDDENKKDLWDAIRRAANPTDEEIMASNAALRERLKGQARQASEGTADSGGA